MGETKTLGMRDVMERSAKTLLFFLIVGVVAMSVTALVAWIASWFGANYWGRLANVVGAGSPGSIYVLGSTWLVVAAFFLSFPEVVKSFFRYATYTLIDLWFSILGALTGSALVISVVLSDYRALIWSLIFILASYFGIFAVHRWLNPIDFTFPQRLGLSALLLLMIPLLVLIV